MKTSKSKNRSGSDTDKALAGAGKVSTKNQKPVSSKGISLDAVVAEKDEVKNAEERLRQKKDDIKKS